MDGTPIGLLELLSRRLVAHRTIHSIHPRTSVRKMVWYPIRFAKTDRSDSKCLVPQEGAPALGGRIAPPGHVAGHRGLRYVEPKFEQFAMEGQ